MVDQEIINLPDDSGTPLNLAQSIPMQGLSADTRRRTLGDITSSFVPSKLLYVKNQIELQAQFGNDIIIPDAESWTVVTLESFPMSKPFKLGDNSTLEIIEGSANLEIEYTGPGFLFQLENTVNPARSLILRNIDFNGDGTNDIFDLKLTSLFLDGVTFINFNNLGTVETLFYSIEFTAILGIKIGLVIKNAIRGRFDRFNLNQGPSTPPVTLISILGTGVTTMNAENVFSSDTNSTVFFLDKNAGVGSSFIVKETTGAFANLFKQGTDIAINSVADNGSGNTRHTTASPHNLQIGDAVVISGFVTQTTYNGTFIVTAIPSGTEFDVAVAFVATDTGNMNTSSRDSTDILVDARDNPGQPSSMTTGEASLELGSPITVIITTGNVPEVISDSGWTANNLERITEDTVTPNQGRLIIDALATRRYSVTYSATIQRSGGGGVNVGIVLLKNGSIIGVNPPRVFTTSVTPLTRTDIVELTETDVIQIGVINYISTIDIDVYQANLSVILSQ